MVALIEWVADSIMTGSCTKVYRRFVEFVMEAVPYYAPDKDE